MPEQRDICLLPIPFTDLTSSRQRPVIVISNDEYNNSTQDFVVVAMTSNPPVVPHSFTIDQKDLESGQLNRPGKVRVDKIYTLSQSLARRVFGKVNESVLDEIRGILNQLIASG